MSIKEHLTNLIVELHNTHSSEFSWTEEHGFPDFITDETHQFQIHFTRNALQHLNKLSLILYQNRPKNNIKIELDAFAKSTKQVIANMFALGKFDNNSLEGDRTINKELKQLIEENIKNQTATFTHYFPAWTLGLESDKPYEFGPVTIYSNKDWLSTVDFPQHAKDMYFGGKDVNERWKETVVKLLDGEDPCDLPPSLATDIYRVIKDCPSLVKVTISGFEKNFSRKLALIIAQAALDAISLLFKNDKLFLQQAIYGERVVPFHSYRLMETDSFLWSPGWALSKRVNSHSKAVLLDHIAKAQFAIPSLVSILNGLLTPEEHAYPKLTMRWATALNWLAEGCRESNDAIAIAKLGSSLDVLSCGGKADGISKMVSNLLRTAEDSIVLEEKGTTLNAFIKQIYDDGRSQILHGTYCDRLKSFEKERAHAFTVASTVLMNAAICLSDYKGTDEDKAFRTMRPLRSS